MLPPSEEPNSSSTTTTATAPQNAQAELIVSVEQHNLHLSTDPPENAPEIKGSANVTTGEAEERHEEVLEVIKEEGKAEISCDGAKEEEKAGEVEEGGLVKVEETIVTEVVGATESEQVVEPSKKEECDEVVEKPVDLEVTEQAEEKRDGGENDDKKSEVECTGAMQEEEECKKVEEDRDVDLLKLDEPEPPATKVEEDDGIVRATFTDFVDDEAGGDEEGEEDDGMLLMGNPDLQRIREEQVRKWLIFEQENPVGGVGSLTESMEADSLATGGSTVTEGQLMLMNGETEGDDQLEGAEGGDQDGVPRRVRFLTDQEGNLLISVFMTNSTPTATTPLSEETSILSNGGQPTDEEMDAVHLAEQQHQQQQSPSLVVSPPSLENTDHDEKVETQEEELVDSIEPSAPPIDDDSDSDGEEPPSIVLIAPIHPKEPPSEKPPAIPVNNGDDSANESSDETLSVSSCNSMIEIMPSNETPSRVAITLEQEDKPEITGEEIYLKLTDSCSQPQHIENQEKKEETDVDISNGAIVTPCFQLGVQPPCPGTTAENDMEEASGSPQPASLIIHDMEEHNEGMADRNRIEESNESAPPLEVKVPNVDENNNVVEDSVLEEDEDDDNDNEVIGQVEANNNKLSSSTAPPPAPVDPPQFNPEIGEQVMPELRRSTSSSSGEVEEELERVAPVPPPVPPKPEGNRHLLLPSKHEEDQEAQMVSLCIQEEHISAVSVTIAKWESMTSKAQSTENLTNVGLASSPQNCPSGVAPSVHAPVTKSASSPCPKTSSHGLLSPTPPQPPQKPCARPIQPVVPVQTKGMAPPAPQQQQVNRLVIHGTNSPVSNEPLKVNKAAGWSCWGNKGIKGKDACPTSGGMQASNIQQENGHGMGDDAIYAQPNHQAGSTMTSIQNPSAILKSYPKPLSRGEIVNWLREGEIHRAGLLLNYTQSHHHAPVPGHHGNHSLSPVLVSWFFGLISRQQAERYLQGQPPGTFLVRISTRIWGYTLSYQASTGRTKHFLISAVNPAVPSTLEIGPPDAALPPQSCKQQRMSPFLPQGRYAFIGTNMTPYGTLVSLIRHHSHAPITKLGGEKLLNPCPGGPQVAGLENLFKHSAASASQPPATASSNNIMISSA